MIARVAVSLRIVHPRDVVQTIALDPARALVIGRTADEPNICIPHRTVSRAHARLEQVRGTWTIRDLGSHNGSWCDGARFGEHPVQLRDGAVLRMGDAIGVIEHDPPTTGPIRPAEILTRLDILAAAWAERNHRSLAPFDLRADAAETIVRFAWSNTLEELDRLVHVLALAGDGSIALAHLPAWLRDAGTEAEAPIDDPTKDDVG